jgi:pyrimidine deaminase RibD-like protein
MRLSETGIQYQKTKFGQLASQITADRETKLKPLDHLPRGGAAQVAKVRVHVECIESLAQAFVGAYIEAYQKTGVDINNEDAEAIISELRGHVKMWFASLQTQPGIGRFLATQPTDANAVVARARLTILLNVLEGTLAQDRAVIDALERKILQKLGESDITFTIAQLKISLAGCSNVTDRQWFAVLESLRLRGLINSRTPAGPFLITDQGKNYLQFVQRNTIQAQGTIVGEKHEIHGQAAGTAAATAMGSDFWRSIQDEFRTLAQEEKSRSPNNADDSWLIASVSYRDPSTPYGDWTVYRGMSEDFKARFEALATRAGKALEPTAPCKPLHVWLHRLFLNLLEHESAFLFAAEKGVGGIIKTVSAASAAYSARLEMYALERADDRDVEYVDRRFAQTAIEEALKSVPEDERPHPKVGAVVVRDGNVIATAHRGEFPGSHAEFIALEKKLADSVVAGATVYTTLEPCTVRNDPKIACAFRLAERRVARVVIGMLDPNPVVLGKGWQVLRDAGIETQFFPHDLMTQVEDMNRQFIRDQRAKGQSMISTPKTNLESQPTTFSVGGLSELGGLTLQGYKIYQALKLNAYSNGIEGSILILIDERVEGLKGCMQRHTYSDTETLHIEGWSQPNIELKQALLLIVDERLRIIYSEQLGRESARLDRAFLYPDKSKPTFILTRDYSAGMGSYNGPISYFLEVSARGIHYTLPYGLMTSLKTAWIMYPSCEPIFRN